LRRFLDWFFAPEWAGGWTFTRYMWCFAAFLGHGKRIFGIPGPYANEEILLTSGYFKLVNVVIFSPTTAMMIWAGGVLGILMVARGGKTFHLGLMLWFVCAWALLAQEALNIKAWDRLTTWIALVLMFSPAYEERLWTKKRSPAARYSLLILFCAIYGSTGWMKFLNEPAWLDGSVLQYHLVHQWHAGNRLAAWVSGHRWLTAPMCWWTLLFECGFPFLVWWKRANPPLLLLGALFHVGLLLMMQVGPFGFVSLAAYPVLMHPEAAKRLFDRGIRRFGTPMP